MCCLEGRTTGHAQEEEVKKSGDEEVGVIKSHLGAGPPHMNAQSCSFATTRHPVQLDPMHTPEMLAVAPDDGPILPGTAATPPPPCR